MDPLASFWVSRHINKSSKGITKLAFIQDDEYHRDIINFI